MRLSLAFIASLATFAVACGGVVESGGGEGDDATAPPSNREGGSPGADADASLASDAAGLDATLDGTALDGNQPDDASTTSDAADSAAASDDASTDAAPGAGIDAGTDASLVVLVAGATASAIAIDDTNVYFTAVDGGGVDGIPKAGGPTFVVAQLAGGSGGDVLHLAEGTLYWLTTPPGPNDPLFASVPASARDAPTTFLDWYGVDPVDFVVVDDELYVEDGLGDVAKIPTTPDAGSYTVVYYTNATTPWGSFQYDAENALLDALENGSGQIDRIPLDGGAMTTLDIDPMAAMMAIQGSTMYWGDIPNCYPVDGGLCLTTLYASALDGSDAGVVASGWWPFVSEDIGRIGPITSKYMFLLANDSILRITLATGESHVVYSYPESPSWVPRRGSVAADEDFLYLVDPTAGLLRIAD